MATEYWVVIGSLPAMPGTSWDRHFTRRPTQHPCQNSQAKLTLRFARDLSGAPLAHVDLKP